MNDDIRIGIEVIGDLIKAQNEILEKKLNSLNSLVALEDMIGYFQSIQDELSGMNTNLKNISETLKK